MGCATDLVVGIVSRLRIWWAVPTLQILRIWWAVPTLQIIFELVSFDEYHLKVIQADRVHQDKILKQH